jgi:dipeptidase E
MKRLLLMSSSRKGDGEYLEHADEQFRTFLRGAVGRVLFIPYAAVTYGFGEYEGRVAGVFARLGVEAVSIHRFPDARRAVEQAEAIVVGGGNTFVLLQRLYASGLVEAVRERVEAGTPYIGWSAGTNVACPTIRTTNDMPVAQPPSLDAFRLVPFQINPHFIPGKPEGHNGESREERLAEFLVVNPGESVLALREGSALLVEGAAARLLGDRDALVFRQGGTVETIGAGESFSVERING